MGYEERMASRRRGGTPSFLFLLFLSEMEFRDSTGVTPYRVSHLDISSSVLQQSFQVISDNPIHWFGGHIQLWFYAKQPYQVPEKQ